MYRVLGSQNVGIAGGKDFSALYFVGLSDSDKLLYLDPHYVQRSIPSWAFGNEESMLNSAINEYHCKKMKVLKLDQMCTSVAMGFYIRNADSFKDFKEKILVLSKQ